ncbi:MAG: hypothetical protein Q9227_009488 [Pyrenula ochraceoflavens]
MAMLYDHKSIGDISSQRRDVLRARAGDRIQKGYVAFGDSYAAGTGTGETSEDGCRRGQYSYPKQVAAYAPKGIEFQNLACGGAEVDTEKEDNLFEQIKRWKNPHLADIATLTIGGNDVRFLEVLSACIQLFKTVAFSGDCDEEINNAYRSIDQGTFPNGVKKAMQQIVEKSGRQDFELYVTGYPEFFNAETEWQVSLVADYLDISTSLFLGGPLLTKDLRRKTNGAISHFNAKLSSIIETLNKDHYNGTGHVKFIDPNPFFKFHRFCDVDEETHAEVHEPDSQREDTFFFVSSLVEDWDDILPPIPPETVQKRNKLMNHGEIGTRQSERRYVSPDPHKCNGVSGNWEDRIACGLAKVAAVNGTEEQRIVHEYMTNQTDQAPVHIRKLTYQTKWAKTFHPRTLGHKAYADALLAAFVGL